METLLPNPIKLLVHFGDRKWKYVFDLPPTMPLGNIGLDGEREFISINGRINRLTVYSPDIQKSAMAAVMLPSNITVRGEQDSVPYTSGGANDAYLSIPDESLLYSHLLNPAYDPDIFHLFTKDKRRIVFSSDKLPKDTRIGEFFEVISETDHADLKDLLDRLRPSKVFPRFEVDSGQYYDYVRSISDPLWIGESLYLFKKDARYVLARKIGKSASTEDAQ